MGNVGATLCLCSNLCQDSGSEGDSFQARMCNFFCLFLDMHGVTLKLVMMSMVKFFFFMYIGFLEILCALYFGDGYTFKLQDPLPHPSHFNHSDLYDFGCPPKSMVVVNQVQMCSRSQGN